MVRKEEGQESCFLLTHYGMQNIAVITSLQTLLRSKAAEEKGPVTELEPGTYTFSRSFSHTSYQSQSQILLLPSPYVPTPQNITIKTKTDVDQLGVGVSKKALVTCTSADRLLDTASGHWFWSGWLPFIFASS